MIQSMMTEQVPTERLHLVNLVRKYGDVNTDGLLEDTTLAFFDPQIEGFIGYKVKSSNAVVYGDPVCSEADKPALAISFQNFCKFQGLGVVYTIVSESFADFASMHLNAVAVEFGKKYILDPQQNPVKNTGSKAVLVRKKVKQALSEGVIVREYIGEDIELEKRIESVANSWVEKRQGPQIYLCQISLFNDRLGKRYIYAEKENNIVGLLVLNEIQARKGWLLNNVMTVKEAPKGLSELLVISSLQILEKENCNFVLVGPVPAHKLGQIVGLKDFGVQVVRMIFQVAKYIFHLEGHETFWDKFQPKTETSFLLFPERNLGYSSIKALMNAYNVGKR